MKFCIYRYMSASYSAASNKILQLSLLIAYYLDLYCKKTQTNIRKDFVCKIHFKPQTKLMAFNGLHIWCFLEQLQSVIIVLITICMLFILLVVILLLFCWQGPVQLRFERVKSGSLPPKFSEVTFQAGPEDRYVSMANLYKSHSYCAAAWALNGQVEVPY